MFNILSYVGMNLQAEVCLWTLMGLVRTIFDATLFKVNSNLIQVWQMKMPPQLSKPVQRVLRTMVSGVMLEERPTLVLPWLLLAAVRKLLCELMSLALGLGTCVLLGPGRPACVRFLITKIMSIAPAFYMWILVLSYYHALKMTVAFKTFPAVVPSVDRDLGLELAVRRRRTKSLFDEDQLRRKIIAGLYEERPQIIKPHSPTRLTFEDIPQATAHLKNIETIPEPSYVCNTMRPLSVSSNRTVSDLANFEDYLASELIIPRDTDRILEQFITMSLRIAYYLKNDGTTSSKYLDSFPAMLENNTPPLHSTAELTEPSHLVGSSKGKVASYLTNYPQIFMKKNSDIIQHSTPELNKMADKTENKGVGSRDVMSLDSVQYSQFMNISKRENKDNYELSNISSAGTKVWKDNANSSHNEAEIQTSKSGISITMKVEPEESFEYVVANKEKRLSQNSIPKEENKTNAENKRDDQNPNQSGHQSQ
ncbi:PREDICTED: uncharacterized protein LOC106107399 isoform X2 [Papilio polytes]|uniref:uncharacterized protein LOC106107399 isoform X2 n=1 Tax=Papilio polytes TaxID=76194 RepID=UPI00067626CE|nr:PREDICTED: uncharacterized protein LOC106107399 isoform X2 [Papilio polytes]